MRRLLLDDDHSELDSLLAEFFAALDAGNLESIYRTLDFFWARLAVHIRAEHLHLFPAILEAAQKPKKSPEDFRASPPDKARNAIEELRSDHNFFMREMTAAIKTLRALREDSNADFPGKVAEEIRRKIMAVKIRLDAHNNSEETQVYRLAERLLDAAALVRLNEKMRGEIENLPPRISSENAF